MSGDLSAPWASATLEPVTPTTRPRPYSLGGVSFRQLEPAVPATLDVVADGPGEALSQIQATLASRGFQRGTSLQMTRAATRTREPLAAGTILVTYEGNLRADRTRGGRVRRIALLLIAVATTAGVLVALSLAGVLAPMASLTVLVMAAGGLLGVGMNLLPTYDFWSEILVAHVPPSGKGAASGSASEPPTVRVEVRCATARTQNTGGGGPAIRSVKATYRTPAASDTVALLTDSLASSGAARLA